MKLFYKLIPYCCLMFISGNVAAEQYTVRSGEFKNIQVSDSWSQNYTTTGYAYYQSAGASLVGFTNKSAVNNLCIRDKSWTSESPFYKVTTIDGYTGIEVANGIVLVPININASGSGEYTDNSGNKKTFNTSETSNEKGLRSKTGTYSNPNIWCSTLQPVDSSYTGVINVTRTSGGSVNWGIYASNTAASGVYNIPDVFIGTNYINGNDSVSFGPSKLNRSSISIWRPLECNIYIPNSTVNFGSIDASGDGWAPLKSQNLTLQINCTGGIENTTTSGTISFTGNPLYYGRSEKLELTTDGSYGVGVLNGRYGLDKQSICSPDNTNDIDAIKFDGTTSKTLNLKAGQNEIPITWTVCRRGDIKRYGVTSAKVTVNINWD